MSIRSVLSAGFWLALSLTPFINAFMPSLPLRTVAEVPLSGGATRLDYVSLDPQRKLLFVAHLGASIVHVIDTRTDRLVADIPDVAQVHGILAVPGLQRVYASATGDHRVAVIDEKTLKVIARVPAGDYPDGLAYAPREHEIFVSDESGQGEPVIDTRTNRQAANVAIGGEAGNTQYDPVTNHILVNVQTSGELVELDPSNNRVVARHALPAADHNHGLYIDAPRRLAFVACEDNARLLVVDLKTWRVVESQTVGAVPDVLAFDPGWHLLYVAAESGVLSVFQEQGRGVKKLAEGFVAANAHTVAVDPVTHALYLPLINVAGKPQLRVAQLRIGLK